MCVCFMYVGACVETSGDNLSKSAPPSTTQGPQLELRSSGFSADSWIHWAISPARTLKKAKQRPKANGTDGMLCERVEGWLEGWAGVVGSQGRAGVKGTKRLLRALPTSLGFCWVVGWLLIVWWIFFCCFILICLWHRVSLWNPAWHQTYSNCPPVTSEVLELKVWATVLALISAEERNLLK